MVNFPSSWTIQLKAKAENPAAPAREMSDPTHFLRALRTKLDSIERRHRWKRIFALARACALHLMLEGDEDDA
jgi:hypothetical protein